ncbi:hypothetical protein EJB05_37820, partial [Eragrostis curvula]
MALELINANPVVYEKKERPNRQVTTDKNAAEAIDHQEVFDILFGCIVHRMDIIQVLISSPALLRCPDYIKDPEHPYSLEELNVVTEDSVEICDGLNHVIVTFTPTVEHCSMATVIGLCIRVKLMRSLPPYYKVDIRIAPGSHASESDVNKRLNDKERVLAALENADPDLLDKIEECLSPTFA